MPRFIPTDAQKELIRQAEERARHDADNGHVPPEELLRRMQAEAAVEDERPASPTEATLVQRLKDWFLCR